MKMIDDEVQHAAVPGALNVLLKLGQLSGEARVAGMIMPRVKFIKQEIAKAVSQQDLVQIISWDDDEKLAPLKDLAWIHIPAQSAFPDKSEFESLDHDNISAPAPAPALRYREHRMASIIPIESPDHNNFSPPAPAPSHCGHCTAPAIPIDSQDPPLCEVSQLPPHGTFGNSAADPSCFAGNPLHAGPNQFAGAYRDIRKTSPSKYFIIVTKFLKNS
ncbi:hypothetical protein BDP27DRAFT_1431471 [Rhodocollybia butyracea]|uniref:Uncharacterized protein n=1 Tax=Rhodocollybia butyracea TaxID=206335 RepID=A0A9P5TYJ1_9AGAR|nr:hypothetical protein BDP27DRAFT_1431471 [Rhodocollybia butyracea]